MAYELRPKLLKRGDSSDEDGDDSPVFVPRFGHNIYIYGGKSKRRQQKRKGTKKKKFSKKTKKHKKRNNKKSHKK